MKSARTSIFRRRGSKRQQGFTMVEVMVSIIVMTVGMVSVLGVFGLAMASTATSQDNAIAKQIADEAIESILTARETTNITWAQIQNTGNGGIFLPGFVAVDCAGVDGIVGTADDAACGPQILTLPGPDGIFGTADDVQYPLTNYQRQIVITPALDQNNNPIPTLNTVTITVQYTTPQSRALKTYVLNTFISEFR